MNALFSDLCFPSPEFQVGRVAFDGSNYYIFIFDTISSTGGPSIELVQSDVVD